MKKALSASSYGRTKVRIEFWSQWHIFRGWTLVDIERKLYKVICIGNLAEGTKSAHQAPFVALLIKGIQHPGEPTGATDIAAPLDAE